MSFLVSASSIFMYVSRFSFSAWRRRIDVRPVLCVCFTGRTVSSLKYECFLLVNYIDIIKCDYVGLKFYYENLGLL